jgi:hypothetical protein
MGLNVDAHPPFGSFVFKLYENYAISSQTPIDVTCLSMNIRDFLRSRDWKIYSSYELNIERVLPLLARSSVEPSENETALRVSLQAEIGAQKKMFEKLQMKARRTRQQNRSLKTKLTSVRASTSWRVTAPLRGLKRALWQN